MVALTEWEVVALRGIHLLECRTQAVKCDEQAIEPNPVVAVPLDLLHEQTLDQRLVVGAQRYRQLRLQRQDLLKTLDYGTENSLRLGLDTIASVESANDFSAKPADQFKGIEMRLVDRMRRKVHPMPFQRSDYHLILVNNREAGMRYKIIFEYSKDAKRSLLQLLAITFRHLGNAKEDYAAA